MRNTSACDFLQISVCVWSNFCPDFGRFWQVWNNQPLAGFGRSGVWNNFCPDFGRFWQVWNNFCPDFGRMFSLMCSWCSIESLGSEAPFLYMRLEKASAGPLLVGMVWPATPGVTLCPLATLACRSTVVGNLDGVGVGMKKELLKCSKTCEHVSSLRFKPRNGMKSTSTAQIN